MQAPAQNLYHKPKTVDELTERNVVLVAQLDKTTCSKGRATARVVDIITGSCGKITFIWAHVL